MMKFADRLVGKGLDTWVITKLIVFNLSWMVVLVVPMAALVSTLMAFGNMSSVHEVTIIKSSGGSLVRMMKPIIVSSLLLTLLLEKITKPLAKFCSLWAKLNEILKVLRTFLKLFNKI